MLCSLFDLAFFVSFQMTLSAKRKGVITATLMQRVQTLLDRLNVLVTEHLLEMEHTVKVS